MLFGCMAMLSLVFLFAGCTKSSTPQPSSTVPTSEIAELEPSPSPTAAPSVTPAALYAECEARVEGPQQAGECSTDAECSTGGCSGEVCATSKAVAELMTSCDRKRCFDVLDRCGCNEGECTWTLKDAVAPPLKLSLPR